jgi:hypothetical protein
VDTVEQAASEVRTEWRVVHRGAARLRARPAAVGEAVLTLHGVEYAEAGAWVVEATRGQRFLVGRDAVELHARGGLVDANRYGWVDLDVPASTAQARPAAAGEPIDTAAGVRTASAGDWVVRGSSGTYLFPGPVFHTIYTEI